MGPWRGRFSEHTHTLSHIPFQVKHLPTYIQCFKHSLSYVYAVTPKIEHSESQQPTCRSVTVSVTAPPQADKYHPESLSAKLWRKKRQGAMASK